MTYCSEFPLFTSLYCNYKLTDDLTLHGLPRFLPSIGLGSLSSKLSLLPLIQMVDPPSHFLFE